SVANFEALPRESKLTGNKPPLPTSGSISTAAQSSAISSAGASAGRGPLRSRLALLAPVYPPGGTPKKLSLDKSRAHGAASKDYPRDLNSGIPWRGGQ
ncbi:MAG: hypothetical protein ABIP67_09485, partial [Burkholderiales bacterium]